MKKFILLPLLLLIAFNANAAFLSGQTITYQYYFPNTSSPANGAASGNYVVGSGVEVNNAFANFVSVDISDTNILVNFSSIGSFNDVSFNGFKISDTFGVIDDFTGISVNAATNMIGLDLSQITVFADEIWVNWAGLSFNTDTIISLDLNPSAVPIPAAAFMFAPALLGFMGLRRRAKNKVA